MTHKAFFVSILTLSALLFTSNKAMAQSANSNGYGIFNDISTPKDDYGTITLIQDPAFYNLISSHISYNKRKGVVGYRIQIDQWSGSNSRAKAYAKAADFKENFPEFDESLVYVPYQAPYYKLRVGDFRNRNEAFEIYNQIKRYYPNTAYIVKTRIKYPKLDKPVISDSTSSL